MGSFDNNYHTCNDLADDRIEKGEDYCLWCIYQRVLDRRKKNAVL